MSTAIPYKIENFPDFELGIILNNEAANSLFLFPPAFGGANFYLNSICSYFSNIKLYVFKNLYLYLQELLPTSKFHQLRIKNVAHEYTNLVKKLNSNNAPYNFFGYSAGGNTIYEVAKNLVKSRANVNYIFMVDSLFNKNELAYYDHTYDDFDLKNSNVKVVLFKAIETCDDSLCEKLQAYLKDKHPMQLSRMDYIMLKFCLKSPKLVTYYESFEAIQLDLIHTISDDALHKLAFDQAFINIFSSYGRANYNVLNSPLNGLDQYFNREQITVKLINSNHMDIMNDDKSLNEIAMTINMLLNK